MAPVRNVTTAQPSKETAIQKSKQQLQMQQQQPHKRPHRSTLRYRNTTGSGGEGGATTNSSHFCGRRPLNDNDCLISTDQQPSGNSTVKTPKIAVTVSAETVFASGNNRNFNKSNNYNNSTATESQRKQRQYSPEEESAETNSVAFGTLLDIDQNKSKFSQAFNTANSAKTAPKTFACAAREDNIAKRKTFSKIQKDLNESSTTASSSLVKLSKANNNTLLPINLLNLATSLTKAQIPVTSATLTAVAANSSQTAFCGGDVNVESILLQRLQLIKYFLSVTAPTVTGLNQRLRTRKEEVIPTVTTPCFVTQQSLPKALMVYENRPESMDREVVVNSTSLEDVALSELSENRAQSIQSLHSVETPTPDTTPSFEELQQRLETSNRNIQNMQEQQQQLLRLQNAAKQHLSEMEHLRQQAGTLSFGANQANASTNGDGVPEYESIDQVHSDMATLVGRMKNLTTFIQNQNELSNLLGDDGPEILAEQEALQRKLESLRAQRDDMRTLVSELQEINRTAERRVGTDANEISQASADMQSTAGAIIAQAGEELPQTNAARVVPVTYTRNVPIKLTNGSVPQTTGDASADEDNDDSAEKVATAMLIQQKVADIEIMRKQLQRLKDMMETVNMIEARTSRDVNDIGRTPPREVRSPSHTTGSSGASFDRECTPVSVVPAHHSSGAVAANDDSYLTRKMRMINEVTSDLRAQAESLQAERDRIKALKDEIVLRKQQAAAAVQLGEDALKRSSLTPTPTPRSCKQRELDTPSPPPLANTENERDQLKMEYEAKKREFELLCQRLQQDDNTVKSQSNSNKAPLRRDTVSEADDEADGEEELIDSDFATRNAASAARQYFAAPQQQSTPAQQHRAAVKAAVTAHTQATGVASAKINPPHRQSQGQRLPVGALGKEDSFETNQTSSTAGERRHSTLANATSTTQDGASFEAGSVQSGSSQSAFSMPPPMPAMGPCSSWPPLPPMPNTWNPQLYYGFGATAGPLQPTLSQPNSATTSQNAGASFTPVGLPPQSAVNSECICSGANSATTAQIVTGPTPTSSSTNTAAQLAADPVLLQQFVQTQQMLINSVCQCNQMLWHQQREIDALNNTIHVLQDRLLALSGGANAVPLAVDLPYTIRAESVPPPSLSAGALPNNLYLSNTNRAQSEQPALFLPGMTTTARNSAFCNYQHHQQQQYQQRQQRGHISAGTGGVTATNSYNFSSESQQHSNIASASSTNAGLYSTLNNAAAPAPPLNQAPQSHYNNEVPQSPPLPGNTAGPGPIFMHHHNNAIHQNNANLRTQNHYANNLHQQQHVQQQQQQHGHSNINVGGGNTLNNQVPPGNRANNYWDNFRSYSRQNLLSTNSNKSNEEQQQQNQLQQQQHQHQHYVQQRLLEQLENPAPSHYRGPQQPHHPSTTALTTSNLQQLQRQQQQQQQEEAAQQQQQQRPTQSQLYRSLGDNNSNNCNNLNFERNANDNKYLRTLQRSHINRYQQQQQQQQQNFALTNSLYTNHRNLYQSWLPTANNDDSNVDMDVYGAYNIIDSDLAAPYAHLSSNICANSSNMLRNMNVNFGNSPHYQRNKLLAKPSCRGTAAEAMEEQHNRNRGQQSQQQQQQQQQQRILSQQQLALRAQLQLEQSTLRSRRNMPAYTQTRYLDLLPATVSEAVARAQAQLRNRDSVDMLLRTVTADDEEDAEALAAAGGGNNTTYSSAYMPNANETLLVDNNEIGNNTPNIDNETVDEPDGGDAVLNVHMDVAHDEEEDDDTTSEEIKRNLLVNALKNDKFTTKFYESIKEDVFRRLERILLEKEAAEANCYRRTGQIRNGLTAASGDTNNTNVAIDGPNDMLGAASLQRDPARKFNLNARMGNQQQQQRLHQLLQHNQQHNLFASPANTYEIKQEGANNYHAAEDDQHVLASAEGETHEKNCPEAGTGDNAEEDEYGVNNADTESNKADNEDAAEAAAAAVVMQVKESEQPEEDNIAFNDSINNIVAGDGTISRQVQPPTSAEQKQISGNVGRDAEGNITTWLQNVLSQAASNAANISTSNIGKKRKNQLEAATKSGAGGDAEAMPFSISANNSAVNNLQQTYYTDLIAYIITRIRNQTHPNTQINDTILVEIAKLTASAEQNFAPTLQNYKSVFTSTPHISPRKFYMKIKKLSLPRQRDEFLQWYENYLENLFPGARLEAERRREELRNSGNAGAAALGLELSRICDKLENHQQQIQLHQTQQRNASNSDHKDIDADLAEADQNSANSSSNTTVEERQDQQHENELENNENPNDSVDVGASTLHKHAEQDDVGAVGGAYAIMPLSAGRAAAAAAATITENAITAALQQHDLLRYATDTIADGGTLAHDFTPHNGYT